MELNFLRKRAIRVRFHVNEEEYAHLKKQVELSGLATEQYLRQLLMGKEIKAKPTEEWKSLIRQLSAIGNNINQIARIANTYRQVSQEDVNQMQEYFAQIWEQVKQL